jgi:DNA-directed RNA polymerase subunit E'
MYKILEIDDKIRVPPAKFGMSTEEAVKSSLKDKWESVVDKRLGVVLSVMSVDAIGEGRILPGDGALHYPITFSLIVYQPELHEVVKGEVIDITEFGAFVRFGPLDGMIHVSQVMNDFVSYDPKNAILLGRDSKRKLKEGDVVVARVVSVSMEKEQYKIGLTARQAGLGSEEWIVEDKKRSAKRASSAEKTVKVEKKEEKKEAKESKAKPKGKKQESDFYGLFFLQGSFESGNCLQV